MTAPIKALGDAPIEMLPDDQIQAAMEFADILADGESLTGAPALVSDVENAADGSSPGSTIAVGTLTISGTQVLIPITTAGATPQTDWYFYVHCPTTLRSSPGPSGRRRLRIISEG